MGAVGGVIPPTQGIGAQVHRLYAADGSVLLDMTQKSLTFSKALTLSGLFTPNGAIAGALGTAGAPNGYPGNPINPNLIPEPSFDFGGGFWSIDASMSVQNGSSFGDGSYLHSGGSTAAGVYLVTNSQKVPMTSGIQLTLSVDMYAGGITAGNVYAGVQAFDASDTSLGTDNTAGTTAGQGWTRYQKTFTTPANTSYVRVQAVQSPSTTNTNASWRRFKLEKGALATPYGNQGLLTGAFPNILIPGLNADQLRGYTPGTGANQVPVLDGSANLPIESTQSGAASGSPYLILRSWTGSTSQEMSLFADDTGTLYFQNKSGTLVAYVGADGKLYATGSLASIGGQSTSGPLGVPAIIARSINQELTSTSATQIFSVTPNQNGQFRLNFDVGIVTAATTISATLTWTNERGSQSYPILSSQSLAVGDHGLPVYVFEATTGGAITLSVTAGTTKQAYVTATAEAM